MPLQATIEDAVDVEEAIDSLTETTTAGFTKQAGEIKRLTDQLDKMQAKMGRPGAANDNFNTKAANDNNITDEKKALSDNVRFGIDFKTMSAGSDPRRRLRRNSAF